MEFFPFADLIKWHSAPLTATIPGEVTFTPSGRKETAGPSTESLTGALLPLSQDDINRQSDGNYTEQDRKLFTTHTLKIGCYVEQGGKKYKINGVLPYSGYTDVNIYYAKGWD